MKNFGYVFSLLSYLLLSFFYFVQSDFVTCLVIWGSLLALKILVRPLRSQVRLFFVIGLSFLILAVFSAWFPWLVWPFDFYILALIGFLLFRFAFNDPVRPLKWSFRFSTAEIVSIFLINVPSILVLIWYYKSHPEVANMWPVIELSWWAIPLVVVGAAVLNGLREEIFFRGLVQTSTMVLSPVWYQVVLQAVLFGFMHYANAFPQGWTGVFLTALWGGAIAIQYQLFKSISLSWVTHAMADAVMFAIILGTRT